MNDGIDCITAVDRVAATVNPGIGKRRVVKQSLHICIHSIKNPAEPMAGRGFSVVRIAAQLSSPASPADDPQQ